MNERERLLATLSGKPADALPWYADLTYLYSSMEMQGTLDDRFCGDDGYLRFHQEMGAGICFYAPMLWEEAYTGGVTDSLQETSDMSIRTIHTPVGSVREVRQYMSKAFTWAIVEHYVKTIQDLRVMLYATEHRKVWPAYDAYQRIDEKWGPDGYAVGLAPIAGAPIQRMMTRWAGVTTTMNIYMDHAEELEAIFLALEEADTSIYDIICSAPCGIVEMPENLSAEITGRHFFKKYNMPYYQKRIESLHKAGKKVGLHNDGTLRGTFDLLGECGFDFIEAITPAPAGDIPLEDLRREAGSGIVLWGGMPGVIFSPCFTEDQFETHLCQAVRQFREDGRCVLGVADQVPPDGLISRIKRVREVIGK